MSILKIQAVKKPARKPAFSVGSPNRSPKNLQRLYLGMEKCASLYLCNTIYYRYVKYYPPTNTNLATLNNLPYGIYI